jgi:hypothetical protein
MRIVAVADTHLYEHDLGPSVHYLEDSGLELEGLQWWGSPWQPEYRAWAFNLARGEALREKWAQIPDAVDVLITHAPPAGTGDRSPIDGRQGCEALRARVSAVRPPLHIFGHIHQDGGLWQSGDTTGTNVTTWEGDRAVTVVDLDTVNASVIPVQVPPRGS